jgi:hypothetical protein
MSAIKGAKKVGFPVGATAALVTWALSRKPGDAHTAQKAGLRARGDRHRQAPLLWCLPSGSSEFQRGMSRVIARIAGPRTRINRSDDENAKCSAPGSGAAQRLRRRFSQYFLPRSPRHPQTPFGGIGAGPAKALDQPESHQIAGARRDGWNWCALACSDGEKT